MELKEFISNTITQICVGVKDAQDNCKKLKARVNPAIYKDAVTPFKNYSGWKYTEVNFKIVLQSVDKEAGKSGIGVLLANVTLGATKEGSQSSSSATSVEFSVPVGLPMYLEDK